ncbi:MAG: hypothetical protein HOJ87_03125 [Rhodospirillaceae bacterium]|jgi:hypothetical protein|nr:hypothetical protein [Rhodospirillaceae bacterium]MBT5561320.1 hypothetical protein [Rhodospirillaceae bacterium]MBT6243395.1 hypothetical protein [Rhodospirillaceae bacterium]
MSQTGVLSRSDLHRIGIEYVYDYLKENGFKGIQAELSLGHAHQIEAHKGSETIFVYVRTEMFPFSGGLGEEGEIDGILEIVNGSEVKGYLASVCLILKGVYSHAQMSTGHVNSEFSVSFEGLQPIGRKRSPIVLSRSDICNSQRDPCYRKFSKFSSDTDDVMLLTKTDLISSNKQFKPEELGRVHILQGPNGPEAFTVPLTHAGQEETSVFPWAGVQYVEVNPANCSYAPFKFQVEIHVNSSSCRHISGLANQQMVDLLSAVAITFPFDGDADPDLVLLTKGVPSIPESSFLNRTKSLNDKNAYQIASWVSVKLREVKPGLFRSGQKFIYVSELKRQFTFSNPRCPKYIVEYVFSRKALADLGFNPLKYSPSMRQL